MKHAIYGILRSREDRYIRKSKPYLVCERSLLQHLATHGLSTTAERWEELSVMDIATQFADASCSDLWMYCDCAFCDCGDCDFHFEYNCETCGDYHPRGCRFEDMFIMLRAKVHGIFDAVTYLPTAAGLNLKVVRVLGKTVVEALGL